MDCGVPFCHTGQLISGMASGCPIDNLIPEWNDLVYRGLWREALDRLHKTNNFPEFTGRVCPAPCEGSCVLGINEPPVTIKNIEVSIIDRGWEKAGSSPSRRQVRTGKKVAVVGSGPAGLSAAAQLNRAGHTVTVFERADRPGGLLMYGIPNMKLDKNEVVLRRIDLLEAEGVTFICGVERGRRRLRRSSSARTSTRSCSAPSARRSRATSRSRPSKPKGIHFAMEFLHANTKDLLDGKAPQRTRPSPPRARTSSIIGGGDTGTDCVGTSLRHGCKCRRPARNHAEGPDHRAPADNPWPEWPKTYKMDYGQEEAAAKLRLRPARVPHHGQEVRRRRTGQRQGSPHRRSRMGEGRQGSVFVPQEDRRHREGPPGAAGAARRWASSDPNSLLLDAFGVERDRPLQRRRRITRSTRPTSRASSPPATAVAASASSSGRSTKAAAPPASAIKLPDGQDSDLP
jgi:glutamate synthase (NADPH/NADH) small chain